MVLNLQWSYQKQQKMSSKSLAPTISLLARSRVKVMLEENVTFNTRLSCNAHNDCIFFPHHELKDVLSVLMHGPTHTYDHYIYACFVALMQTLTLFLLPLVYSSLDFSQSVDPQQSPHSVSPGFAGPAQD